ncbi:hypothetical protein PQX77_016010 [Marasmius sp. AFHP31]|nr:hypothetical protein PQX77_016010 [Marasmius sp. AFHP31]
MSCLSMSGLNTIRIRISVLRRGSNSGTNWGEIGSITIKGQGYSWNGRFFNTVTLKETCYKFAGRKEISTLSVQLITPEKREELTVRGRKYKAEAGIRRRVWSGERVVIDRLGFTDAQNYNINHSDPRGDGSNRNRRKNMTRARRATSYEPAPHRPPLAPISPVQSIENILRIYRETLRIERNALVSVALRVLEYHRGVVFLTTNRIKVFGEAFMSRFSIAVKDPESNKIGRYVIWSRFLELAGYKIVSLPFVTNDDLDDRVIPRQSIEELVAKNFNGRTIENLVRSASLRFVQLFNANLLFDYLRTFALHKRWPSRGEFWFSGPVINPEEAHFYLA